jgi:hypothetical protein
VTPSRRSFALLFATLTVLLALATGVDAASKPNIVLIMADDMGMKPSVPTARPTSRHPTWTGLLAAGCA